MMGIYPSKCTKCGNSFMWFSAGSSSMCLDCYEKDNTVRDAQPSIENHKFDQTVYVQIPQIKKEDSIEQIYSLREAYALTLNCFHNIKHFTANQHIHKALFELNRAILALEDAEEAKK